MIANLNIRRRWFGFSLRTAFLIVTALCVWLGWHAQIVRERQAAVEVLLSHGAILRDGQAANNQAAYLPALTKPASWPGAAMGFATGDRAPLPWIQKALGAKEYAGIAVPQQYFNDDFDRYKSLFPECMLYAAQMFRPAAPVTQYYSASADYPNTSDAPASTCYAPVPGAPGPPYKVYSSDPSNHDAPAPTPHAVKPKSYGRPPIQQASFVEGQQPSDGETPPTEEVNNSELAPSAEAESDSPRETSCRHVDGLDLSQFAERKPEVNFFDFQVFEPMMPKGFGPKSSGEPDPELTLFGPQPLEVPTVPHLMDLDLEKVFSFFGSFSR